MIRERTLALKKVEFKKIAATISPISFLDYKVYLNTLYLHIKKIHKNYAWPEFALDLGFTATNVILHIVKGRRPLSEKAAMKIIKSIDLRLDDRRYLLELVKYINCKTGSEAESAFEEMTAIKERSIKDEIDKKFMNYFKEWQNVVIGEICGLTSIGNDPHAISKILIGDVKPEEVKNSLKVLADAGIIAWDDEHNVWKRTAVNPSTSHEIIGYSLNNYHLKMMELAKQSLGKISGEKRDVSSLTLNLDWATFQKIKGKIHELQAEVIELEPGEEKSQEVFQLNIQFFPLTNINK